LNPGLVAIEIRRRRAIKEYGEFIEGHTLPDRGELT
jgi:hypothetical protein